MLGCVKQFGSTVTQARERKQPSGVLHCTCVQNVRLSRSSCMINVEVAELLDGIVERLRARAHAQLYVIQH